MMAREKKKEKKNSKCVVVVEVAATACQAVPASIALSPLVLRFRHTDSIPIPRIPARKLMWRMRIGGDVAILRMVIGGACLQWRQ
jgi:hypothetical protein